MPHCIQVATLSRELGRLMGWSSSEINTIEWAGYFHDFGKYMIPPHILIKPGTLTDEEWKHLQSHPHAGAKGYLEHFERTGKGADTTVYDCILQHHERWDGFGYPQGRRGSQISTAAQVVSVADVTQALLANRCYRKAFDFEEVVHVVEKERGNAWNPEIADVFLTNQPALQAIVATKTP